METVLSGSSSVEKEKENNRSIIKPLSYKQIQFVLTT